MPPKKIINNTLPRVPRRRVKKDKNNEDNQKEVNQDEVRKNVLIDNKVMKLRKHDIRIVLSNEVVRTQLPHIKFVEDPSDCLKYAGGKLGAKPVCCKKQLNNAPCDPGGKPVKPRRGPIPKKLKDRTVDTCNEAKSGNETEVKKNKKPLLGRPKKNKPAELNDPVEPEVTPKIVKKEKPKIIRKRKLPDASNKPYSGPRTRRKSSNLKELITVVEILSDNNSEQPDNTQGNVDKLNQEIAANSEKEKPDSSETQKTDNVEKDKNFRRSSIESELSWTKDISSSSSITCVTVSSTDFVRIDKKIPVLKLKSINENSICEKNDVSREKTVQVNTVKEMKNNSVRTSSDKINDKIIEDVVDFACSEVNLSSSSTSTSDSKSINPVTQTVSKLNETLNKLSSKLKSFDIESINWIGYTNDSNYDAEKIQTKLFSNTFLKEEANILHYCESIKQLLSEDHTTEPLETRIVNTENYNNERNNNSTSLNDSHKNSVFLEPSSDYNRQKKDTSVVNKVCNQEKELSVHNKSVENNVHHNTYDDDEDDALSLYAESITGIDTSSKNNMVVENRPSRSEEYIPKPVTKHVFEPITYNPTKIVENDKPKETKNASQAIVCEKENADSTSTCRETDTINENDLFYEDRLGEKVDQESPKILPKPSLFFMSTHKPLIRPKSQIFKGMCFFNLMSSCNRLNICKFPHVQFEVADMKKALMSLDKETVIQEYILMRSFTKLKRKYGLCFVEEFIKRKLLRIAVEIALDFANNSISTTEPVTMEIIETVLLYLNNVDLSVCDDLLQHKIKSKNVLLCDCFLETIAVSQNFSRFKSVFINLTNFVFRLGRRFKSDTALHILERVVILPYDEALAQALMKIIRNTDVKIFSSSMIGHLEKRLLASNLEIYNEFRTLKENAQNKPPGLGNCYMSSQFSKDIDKTNTSHFDKNVICSPDTTNLDTMVPPVETIFTRTIDLNKLKSVHTNGHLNSSSSESDDRKNKWSGQNNLVNDLMRLPLRRPFKRRSDMIFSRNNKFQRRSGPNLF